MLGRGIVQNRQGDPSSVSRGLDHLVFDLGRLSASPKLLVMRVLALVCLLVFVSSSIAATSRTVGDLMAIAKKNDIISRFAPVALKNRYPEYSRAGKYAIAVRVKDSSAVVPMEIFAAAPRGATHVYKLAVTLPAPSRLDDNAEYAFGSITGFVSSACLGLQFKNEFVTWFDQSTRQISADGSGEFDKRFGTVVAQLSGSYAFERGYRVLILTREDRPGKTWTNTCRLP